MLSLCSILSTPVFAQPFLPDNNAGNVNIGNPCVSGAATSPTINCDMYEIEGEDAPGRLKAIVWDDKDHFINNYGAPSLFVENSVGISTNISLPIDGYDPDVIILDNLNNPGVDYYVAVTFRDANDVYLCVYDVFNAATSGMTVSFNNSYVVANGTNSAPHLDGWPDLNTMINGQPSLHEFALVHTDPSDEMIVYRTDISSPTFTPWNSGIFGYTPDVAAQTDVITAEQYAFITYKNTNGTDIDIFDVNFTTASIGAPNTWYTATQVHLPRIEALGLIDASITDQVRWQVAHIAATSSGWEIFGHNLFNPSQNLSNTNWDFFSPAVAAGLGPLGPTPGNLCNRVFVVNYFKSIDNVYSTDLSMVTGAWTGNIYRVNTGAINHLTTFPKFVAVSSCSNSGLNLLSAWYDGSGGCLTPGNGQILYKESPGNTMNFKTTSVIDINATQPFLYPNPATEKLYVSGLDKEKQTAYKLIDMSGRVVSEGIYSGDGIETSSLVPGLYVLQTVKAGTTYHLKFTKK